MFDPRELDRVFGALANDRRRRVMDFLAAEPGAAVGEVAAEFSVSRIAVMKHIGVLEDAGLVVSRKEGRTRRLYLNAAPLRMLQDRWMTKWSALWARRLVDIKYALEERREPWKGSAPSCGSTSRRPSRTRGGRSRGPGPSSGTASTPSSEGR